LHAPDVSAKASLADLHALGLHDRRRHGPLQERQESFRPRRREWCSAIVLLYVTLVSSGCQAWAAGRTGRRIFTAVPVELLSDCRDPSSLARGLCAHLKSPASLPNSLHNPVLPFPTGPRGSDGHAGGFVEWGKAGKPPLTYLADGWARQGESVAPPITVFERCRPAPSGLASVSRRAAEGGQVSEAGCCSCNDPCPARTVIAAREALSVLTKTTVRWRGVDATEDFLTSRSGCE